MSVVQLTRLCHFTLTSDRRVETTKMTECGRESETVQHLSHSALGAGGTTRAPVSGGQRVGQTFGDGFVLDGARDVHLTTFSQFLLEGGAHLFGELTEELTEETTEKRTSQIQTLVTVVIAIVAGTTAQRTHDQTMNTVAEEVGLFGLVELTHRNVRQHLTLHDVLCVLETFVTTQTDHRTTTTDVVERHLTILNHVRLGQTGTKHVEHLPIGGIEIVADVLEDLAIALEAERTEHDHCRDILPNVGQRSVDVAASASHQLEVHGGAGPAAALQTGAHLGHVAELGGRRLRKDVHMIGTHLLLRHQHLLGAVDHKVAALIVGTFTILAEMHRVQVAEMTAELRTQHDGHATDPQFVEHFRLLLQPLVHLTLVDQRRLLDVQKEQRRVGKISKASLIGQQLGGVVVLCVCRPIRVVALLKADAITFPHGWH
mmetsp:Transcript_10450/g.26295  ORF Transcript_10450/g.26295 Transcript_10450/m.26295 type:complete len:430 (-) Transcript_10450:421-1710(-)